MHRTARDVHAALTRALEELRRSEQNAVLLFAEIMQRELYRELGYASIHAYATESLDFSASKTAQFIQLAKRMEELPRLRQAVERGEVVWTGARTVAGIATPESEDQWVEEAKRLSRRDLRRKIDEARKEARHLRRTDPAQGTLEPPLRTRVPSSSPAGGSAGSHTGSPTAAPANARADADGGHSGSGSGAAAAPPEVMFEVKLRFTATQYGRYQALIEARRKVGKRASREELVLEGLASEAEASLCSTWEQLTTEGSTAAGSAAAPTSSTRAPRPTFAPPYRIVTYVCESCGRAHTPTPRGNLPVPLAELQAQLSDAEIVPARGRRRKTIPPAVRAKVLARDGHRCTAKGCANTQFLEVHHKVPVTAGGTNAPENLVTLCHRCHRALHEGKHNSHISQQHTRVQVETGAPRAVEIGEPVTIEPLRE